MKILQVMSGAGFGGAETFFVDLVSALHQTGLEQRVVIRSNEQRASDLQKAGIGPIQLPFRKFGDFTTRRALSRQIREFRPDIVQTWMSRASVIPIKGDFIHVGWLGGYYDLKYFRQCDELVGVTRDLVEHVVRNGWERSHSHYIQTFSSCIPAPPLDRGHFDTPENVPLILALGRLHDDKGFDVLLKALKDVPDAWLWIAGEGPLRNMLANLAKETGVESRVRFLGWRNDRAALYASCDLCVMPSRIEPFGTVMIEAWAYGCPVIAAMAVGPAGLIRNGEDGLLVPVGDAGELTVAIRNMLFQPGFARKMADAGRKAYEANYTEEIVVRNYLSFYNSLINSYNSVNR